MKFIFEFRGQQYVADAQQVGGYTMVYVSRDNLQGADKIVFQLFPTDLLSAENQSTPVFLERAVRVALAQWERIHPSFEQVNVIPYNVETTKYSSNLKPIVVS